MVLMKGKRSLKRGRIATILVLTVLLSGILLAGCGKKAQSEGQEETGQPQVSVEKVDESGGSVVFEGTGPSGEPAQGRVDVRKERPTEEDLGAPVYPKAQYSQDSGTDATVSAGGKELRIVASDFVSGDPYRTVVEWYRKKLGEPLISLAEETTWIKSGGERSMVTVAVRHQEGKTWINIRRLTGDLDLPLPQLPPTGQ
jgi:hypothetical protein